MRSFLIFSMLFPLLVSGQINRSAREFAGDQIQQYIKTKLFKGDSYKAISLGELKPVQEKRKPEIVWSIEHTFEISQPTFSNQKAVPKTYRFQFYLDEKMKILRAETYLVN
jgi:hypothetical protein